MTEPKKLRRSVQQRQKILEAIETRSMSRQDACQRLGVSGRHLKRLIKLYRAQGVSGLVHGHTGQRSNRSYSQETREQVIELYKEKYMGFGPTLASEKLSEIDEVNVHKETLRRWLQEAGLWERQRKRKSYRTRRPRRARYGELLQLDGSIHQWFCGQDSYQCLMNMVDDATGETLAYMDVGETTRGALTVLKSWILSSGIPLSIYVDLKSLYVSPKGLNKDSEEEATVESKWLTHFSKACKKLGIKVIKAHSAQAKGRVERSHAVYQDRFVKELALRGIQTIEGANKLLKEGFVAQLNDKFSKPAESEEDAHVPIGDIDLEQMLCWEYTRCVKNDWTIQFANQHYQIEKTQPLLVRPKQKVLVRCHLDDSISLWYGEEGLPFTAIAPPEGKPARKKTGYDSVQRSVQARKNKHKTPWSR